MPEKGWAYTRMAGTRMPGKGGPERKVVKGWREKGRGRQEKKGIEIVWRRRKNVMGKLPRKGCVPGRGKGVGCAPGHGEGCVPGHDKGALGVCQGMAWVL